MADDWRLHVALRDPEGRFSFLTSMRETALERDAEQRLGDRVAVSADGDELFLYASSAERIGQAERVVRALLDEHNLEVKELAITRWHPDEERWEDPTLAVPRGEDERAAEHERLQREEEAQTRATGQAEWEVRVELPSHGDAVALGKRLEAEGLGVVRRWRYLLVGAVNEDAARELARAISAEAPPSADVEVELSAEAVQRSEPANPFAIFGGLGG